MTFEKGIIAIHIGYRYKLHKKAHHEMLYIDWKTKEITSFFFFLPLHHIKISQSNRKRAKTKTKKKII